MVIRNIYVNEMVHGKDLESKIDVLDSRKS